MGFQAICLDGSAQALHQVLVETQIVHGHQAGAENFIAAIEVLQVGAGIILAGSAITIGIKRARVLLVAGVSDFQHTPAGEEITVAGVAGRHHAVEHVYAP